LWSKTQALHHAGPETFDQRVSGIQDLESQFNACITDETALKALNARVERAIKQDKITGTPAFFINGKSVGSGEISLAALEKAVAEASK
jgi:protein-disulfide isomerase